MTGRRRLASWLGRRSQIFSSSTNSYQRSRAAAARQRQPVAAALHRVEIGALPRQRAPKMPETGDF
jgi:hypothetical protein